MGLAKSLSVVALGSVALVACARSDGPKLDSAAATVAKTAAAAQVSAGLVTQYPPRQPVPVAWNFDSMPAGVAPAGFLFGRTGGGNAGRWIVRPAENPPSRPNVLVQTDTNRTSNRLPFAVADTFSLRDVNLSVRCRPISGNVDQACGLVFRYLDENNYYVTRANALEGNVRLYYVKDGRRREIASWSGKVARGEWHTLAVNAVGDEIDVSWNGRQVISKRDGTFKGSGRIGVWLKADSYTEYDDLSARPATTGKPR